MRVLHILGTGQPGGVESFVLQLVRDAARHDGHLAVAIIGKAGPVSGQLRDAGAMIVTHGQRDLFRLLASRRFDIVHANSGGRLVRLASKAAGARVISHLHGLDADWLTGGTVNALAVRGHLKKLAIGADRVAVSSEWMLRLLCQPGAKEPAVLLPYGVDTLLFSPESRERHREPARRRLGIAPGAHVIGFAGRLVPQKGVEHVISIAAAVQCFQDVVVVVVGAGPSASLLESAVAGGLTNLRLAGPSIDMPAMMASFDVTVVPSVWEPFGIVALESAAMGIPAVAFNVGGLPEAIADGITGLIVPPGDTRAIAANAMRLLRDPELSASLGQQGRVRVQRDFSSENSSRRVFEQYRELSAGRTHDR